VKPVLTRPAYVPGEVSGEIVGGRVVRDDVDDFVAQCIHEVLQAQAMGKEYQMLPELAEEEAL
jgi:hypothetical protein